MGFTAVPRSAGRADDADGAAGGVLVVRVERDAERVVDRGQQVLGRDGPFLHVAAARLAGADDPAPLDAAAAEQDGEAVGPVVAAGVAVDQRRAAELAGAVDDDVVEHAALVEVFDERGDRRVERRQVLFEVLSRCRRDGPSSRC